jgi:rsbT co-antagonist protein RsbR
MSDETVTVDAARIQSLLAAVSFVSLGMFDAKEAQVEVRGEDDFGYLESAFAMFIAELAAAKVAERKALADSETAREEVTRRLLVIEHQRHTIRALSTPIIDLWDGVLTLPLVGTVDTQRTVEMTEQLLDRIVATGAEDVILDLTGVEVVDTMTADHIGKLTRAAALLGCRCTITGIGPNIARTLVGIGVDLGEVRTLRTLKDGLRACIELRVARAKRAAAVAGG